MTYIIPRHHLTYLDIYETQDTSVSGFLLAQERMSKRFERHLLGGKLMYAFIVAQKKGTCGRLAQGTTSWYMKPNKHALLFDVVAYRGPSWRNYRLLSVIRESLCWLERQCDHFAMRPLHDMHKAVSAMGLTKYANDLITRGRGVQSYSLRMALRPGCGGLTIGAVFTLESLSEDTGCLRAPSDLSEPLRSAFPKWIQSSLGGIRGVIPEPPSQRLAHFSAQDTALHDVAAAAVNALLAAQPRSALVFG